MKTIRWKKGKRFPVKAEDAYNAIEQLRQDNGELQAAALVKEAKHARHPLHKCFCWDDSEAADKWRTHEARMIINSIEVINVEGNKRGVYPAFVQDPVKKKGYLDTESACADIDVSAMLLENALSYLDGFKIRYGQLKQLAEVVQAIERVERRLRQRRRALART